MIKSKCDWHEYGDKSTEFILNLEKHCAYQNMVKSILRNGKEVINKKKLIMNCLIPFQK